MIYLNEIEPFAADFLELAIEEGLLPKGHVDRRSIEDVQPDDLKGYTQCHFFAGLGGWPFAARLAGWPEENVLWTGSCPCQPFSVAGKGRGFEDERHLWPVWLRLITERKPPVIAGEQSAAASQWVGLVRSDLEENGYAVGAIQIEAASAGAKHKRDRWWFIADAEWDEQPRKEPRSRKVGRVGRVEQSVSWDEPWESALSRFRALADGLPRSVGATDAARNAIVPQVAATFLEAYLEA